MRATAALITALAALTVQPARAQTMPSPDPLQGDGRVLSHSETVNAPLRDSLPFVRKAFDGAKIAAVCSPVPQTHAPATPGAAQ